MTVQGPIQWFPGHMAKTRRLIKEALPLVDIVVEIRDARVPLSSQNPVLHEIIGAKPRLILLNKCDLADASATDAWAKYYEEQKIPALAVDCKNGRGLKSVMPLAKKILAESVKERGKTRPAARSVRLMVVGIPNVGKSSLINRLAGLSRARVADRPGVTRGNQWFSVAGGGELLDTPGVLWPKFDDPTVGLHLAWIGSIKDEIMDAESLAASLLQWLRGHSPASLAERYGLGDAEGAPGHELLMRVGRHRGMLIAGGEVDTERAAVAVLDDFRAGKLGRVTLERP